MPSCTVNLNAEQQQAVEHFNGPCLVTAVPGAGKTATLTRRVLRLMERGVEARNICCVTFTNKAATEMKERILELNAEAGAVWVSTFHKLCLQILRTHGDEVGLKRNFSIYDTSSKKTLLRKIHKKLEEETRAYGDPKLSSEDYSCLVKTIDTLRESAQPFDISSLDDRLIVYLDELRQSNAVDFSGMLYLTWRVLVKRPDIAKKLSVRFQYILVDEMQDTNSVQYALLKILAAHNNLFMVADHNQSIFGWRGAKPDNLNFFKKDFDSPVFITLPRNYRSHEEVLKAAVRVIKKNDNAKDIELISEKGTGGLVHVAAYETDWDEAAEIARTIAEERASNTLLFKDIAIIYRMKKAMYPIEMQLNRANIPYKTKGTLSFFAKQEIATVLAYMTLLVNPDDFHAFRRVVASPKIGVGKVTLAKIENLAKEKGITILEAAGEKGILGKKVSVKMRHLLCSLNAAKTALAEKKTIRQAVGTLIEESGYVAALNKPTDDVEEQRANETRLKNVKTLLEGLDDFEKAHKNAGLDVFLQQAALSDSSEDDNTEGCVTLTTMHAAKGLEFQHVFIVGCNVGVIPHYKAKQENREDEERRLFYVAMTRAKKTLSLSYTNTVKIWGKTVDSAPSPYLADVVQ